MRFAKFKVLQNSPHISCLAEKRSLRQSNTFHGYIDLTFKSSLSSYQTRDLVSSKPFTKLSRQAFKHRTQSSLANADMTS
jgi:hypothetical protein